MINFEQYLLTEGNAAGKAYEKKICRNVNALLSAFPNIDAYRFDDLVKHLDDVTGRTEDYPDICVLNLNRPQNKVFIECKQSLQKANVANAKYVFDEDGKFHFTKGIRGSKTYLDGNEWLDQLANDIMANEQYKKFADFMHNPNQLLDNNTPFDYYIGKQVADDDLLVYLKKLTNKALQNSSTSAHQIPLDISRETCRNVWPIACAWRLSDMNDIKSYDICRIEIDYMDKLIAHHYTDQKSGRAYYIQIGDELYQISDANPLALVSIDDEPIAKFPENVRGAFDLKFTPRMQTGSVYFDSRSCVLDDVEPSNASLLTKNRFPKISFSRN